MATGKSQNRLQTVSYLSPLLLWITPTSLFTVHTPPGQLCSSAGTWTLCILCVTKAFGQGSFSSHGIFSFLISDIFRPCMPSKLCQRFTSANNTTATGFRFHLFAFANSPGPHWILCAHAHMCMHVRGVWEILYYVYTLFLTFYVYILYVGHDIVKHSVLSLVREIMHHRNDCYYQQARELISTQNM